MSKQIPLKDYTDNPQNGPLRRDVYEAKFGTETSEVAFALYDLMSSWHESWVYGFTYRGLYQKARVFDVPKSWEMFSKLEDNYQRTFVSLLNKSSSWSLYQLLSVFDRMFSTGYKGALSMHFDLRHLFNSTALNALKYEIISEKVYEALERPLRLGIPSSELVYIVGALRLFGEPKLLEVLNRLWQENRRVDDVDLVAILDQWDSVKEYPMDWIISMTGFSKQEWSGKSRLFLL